LAYQVIRSAEKELDYWAEQPESHRKTMWRGYIKHPQASLAHWFGTTNAPKFSDRWAVLHHTIRKWSFRFRRGYTPFGIPVKFRCYKHRSRTYAAYHIEPNVVHLYKLFFDKSPIQQSLTLLHEMGHMSRRDHVPWLLPSPVLGPAIGLGAVLAGGPRDRRNAVCTGYSENKCYRNILHHSEENQLQLGDNPRALVAKFEEGSKEGYRDMLDNIDNYVCYMWNRWVDRGYCRIKF